MRQRTAALVLSWLLLAPAVALAGDLSFSVDAPKFPTPFVTAILGLTLTAVVVVGARACVRSPNTMMYMVLSTVAVTAVMVAYSDRLHSEFRDAGLQRMADLEREYQARSK
jgi:ABC-type Fe3+-siderophore transport system permease subunit